MKIHKDRDIFIEKNIGLVHACAHRFEGKGIEYDDLASAGNVGLIKAVDGFDEKRGVKFSTYAVPVILGEIRRLFRDGGSVKVSRSLKELSLKVMKEREIYFFKHGAEPTIQQLAKLMEISCEQVIEAIGAGAPPISLTVHDEESSGKELDLPVASIEDQLENHLSIAEALQSLTELERKLIYLRYFEMKTQTETARALEISQVQVSRYEKKILITLRKILQ